MELAIHTPTRANIFVMTSMPRRSSRFIITVASPLP